MSFCYTFCKRKSSEMNHFRKAFTTGIILFLLHNGSFAQSSISFGINADAGSKSFQAGGKHGLGGSIDFVRMITRNGGLKVSAGYHWFKRRMPKNITEQQWQDSIFFAGVLGHDVSLLP